MKNLKKLGKVLGKKEQKDVFGGCRGCGSGLINPLDPSDNGGNPSDPNTTSCPGPHPTMPGKCFDLRWCIYVYGMPNSIGNCQ